MSRPYPVFHSRLPNTYSLSLSHTHTYSLIYLIVLSYYIIWLALLLSLTFSLLPFSKRFRPPLFYIRFTTHYKYFSIVPVNVLFGTAPITVSIFFPSLKIITVGIDRIPYSVAIEGDSSVFNFTAFNFPEYSSANWSIRGAIIRHGPHHGAQKSTRTGTSDFNTSCSNVWSFTTEVTPLRREEKRTLRRWVFSTRLVIFPKKTVSSIHVSLTKQILSNEIYLFTS